MPLVKVIKRETPRPASRDGGGPKAGLTAGQVGLRLGREQREADAGAINSNRWQAMATPSERCNSLEIARNKGEPGGLARRGGGLVVGLAVNDVATGGFLREKALKEALLGTLICY